MKTEPSERVFEDMGVFWAEIADKNQTSRQISFLKGQLSGVDGSVLDVACGSGRHIIGLSEAGFEVVGLDFSRKLLRITKQRSPRIAVVLGDMRFLPFKQGAFAAAVSIDTSWGYLPSVQEDMQSLTEQRRILRQGGRLVLDVFNPEPLIRKYQHQGISKRLKWLLLPLLLKLNSKRLLFRVYRWLEYPSFRLLQKRMAPTGGGWLHDLWIVYVRATGQLLQFKHQVRLYSRGRLEAALKDVGFEVQAVFGGYELPLFDEDASRLIMQSVAQ